MKVLLIDCCIREEESRTKVLSNAFINKLKIAHKDITIQEVKLYRENIHPLLKEDIKKRDLFVFKGDYSDSMFSLAHKFKDSDVVIVATPLWDLSFPSLLKVYFENIFVNGLTFMYQDGIPVGLSKVTKAVLIATSGGEMIEANMNYIFDAIDFLANKKVEHFKSFVSMLDVLDETKVKDSLNKEIEDYDRIIKQI